MSDSNAGQLIGAATVLRAVEDQIVSALMIPRSNVTVSSDYDIRNGATVLMAKLNVLRDENLEQWPRYHSWWDMFKREKLSKWIDRGWLSQPEFTMEPSGINMCPHTVHEPHRGHVDFIFRRNMSFDEVMGDLY